MPDAGPVVGGAAQGAATGAAIGSVIPGIGTAIGAVVGGVVGAIGGLFSSQGASQRKQARKKQQEARLITTFLERRRLIQSYARQRSQVLALGLASGAGVESSGIAGSQNSLQTQTQSNLDRNAQQITLERQASKLYSKAETNEANAAAVGNVLQAASTFSSIIPQGIGYSAAAQRAGTGSYVGSGSVPLSAPPLSVNTSPFTGP